MNQILNFPTNLSHEESEKRFAEFRKRKWEIDRKADEEIRKILDTRQIERLIQLRLQHEGVITFNLPEIAKQIGITKEQKNKIRQLQIDFIKQNDAIGKNKELTEHDRVQALTRLFEKVKVDILSVLTNQQKAKWIKMKGKEFTFPNPFTLGPKNTSS